MEIKSKEDLNFLVESLQNKNIKIENKESLLLGIREGVVRFFLNEGDIPPSFYINLYKLFRNAEISKNETIQTNISILENYYEGASLNEKLLINNVLLILHILNGNADYFSKYVKKLIYINPYEAHSNSEYNIAMEFIKECEDVDGLIKGVKLALKDEALKYFHKIVEINIISFIWNSKLYVNPVWKKVFDDFFEVIRKAIESGNIDFLMNMHFMVYHIYGNLVQTIDEWKIYNKNVEIPASNFYKEWGRKNNLKKCKDKISENKKKIGFLIDRIVLNSPLMVIYSLIKSLMENQKFKEEYEIYIYSMRYIEKQEDDDGWVYKFKSLGVKVYIPKEFDQYDFMVSHKDKALAIRDKIIEDGIDYLIGGAGYDISTFIFSNRSAPKQIFWSHGNCAGDLDEFDIRISHFSQECKDKEWRIFNIKIADEFLVGNKSHKQKAKVLKDSMYATFGKDTVFLGTIGRYVKIDSDEYIKTIAKIMDQNPNTVYLACGAGDEESIRSKLKKYGIDLERFIFTGIINPHVFGWIIDIWPDSFPLLQGHSRNEYEAKGGAIVGIKSLYPKKYLDSLKKVGGKELLAENKDEYIKLADKLIKKESYRKKVGNVFKKRIESVNEFNIEKFLKVINL